MLEHDRYQHVRADLASAERVDGTFAEARPTHVIHMAARADARTSRAQPRAYVRSNVVGFANVLEACRKHEVQHLTYASSASVYGANTNMPSSVHQHVDHPLNLYAASKQANEAMAHTYAHLYDLPTTGLRLFTVYGPWDRPDMVCFQFAKAILEREYINVYNNGDIRRDFTYIDDVVEVVARVNDKPATPDPDWDEAAPGPATSSAPWRIYNVGTHTPVELQRVIELLEDELGRKALKNHLPLQRGDVATTCADVADLERAIGFVPATTIEEGIARFASWYRFHYRV